MRQEDATARVDARQQGGVVHHLAAPGIENQGPWLEPPQQVGIKKVPGGMGAVPGQGRVKTENIGIQDPVEGDQGELPTRGEEGIIAQAIDPQIPQPSVQPSSHIATADDGDGLAEPVRIAGAEGRHHVIRHRHRVATRGIGPGDALCGEPRQIQVIGADGGGTHKAHPTPRQQGTAHPGDRAHQQHIRIGHQGPVDGAPRGCNHIAKGAAQLGHQGHVLVGDDLHGARFV